MGDITREQIELINTHGSLRNEIGQKTNQAYLDALCTLALEALAKRDAKTTVHKVWRNEYEGGKHFNFVSALEATRTEAYQLNLGFQALRVAVPITITETEGH